MFSAIEPPAEPQVLTGVTTPGGLLLKIGRTTLVVPRELRCAVHSATLINCNERGT